MKDKVVFFILGAVLATFAYMAGNVSQVKAKDEMRVDSLIVNDELILGGDATIHGTLKVASRVDVGSDLNRPHVVLQSDSTGASVFVTNTTVRDTEQYSSIHIFAGPEGNNVPSAAAIEIKEGEQKKLLLRAK